MNQELIDYIKQQTNLNVSKNKISDVLLGQGWQQSELDEAFAAAEGVPLSLKFSGNDPVARQLDYDENGGEAGAGMSRNKIIAIASVLVILAVVAGVIMAVAGGKKNNSNNGANTANKEQPQINNASTTAQAAKKAAEAAEAAKQAAKEAALSDAATELAGLIAPPDGWTLRRGIIRERPLAIFFKPAAEKNKDGKDIFSERINITKENIKELGVAGSDEYVASSKKMLQETLDDYKITAERKVSLADGSSATLIGSTSTKDGLVLRTIQLFAFKGDEAYVVTGVVLDSNWNQEKDLIGAAAMSFKFPG